jgi:hypothetical protein
MPLLTENTGQYNMAPQNISVRINNGGTQIPDVQGQEPPTALDQHEDGRSESDHLFELRE